jgi:hypothetical protein
MTTKKMFTKNEINILTAIATVNSEYYWIARNKNGKLYVYNKEPMTLKHLEYYFIVGSDARQLRLEMFEDIFKNITWENGPVQYTVQFRK